MRRHRTGCCCKTCVHFLHNFEGEETAPITDDHPSGFFEVVPDDAWSIQNIPGPLPGWLDCNPNTEPGPFIVVTKVDTVTIPREFHIRLLFNGRAAGNVIKFRMLVDVTGIDSADSCRYGVLVTFVEDDSSPQSTECGILELYDYSDILSPQLLAGPIYVRTIAHRRGYALTLCYSPDNQVLSASISNRNNTADPDEIANMIYRGTESLHARGVVIPEEDLIFSKRVWMEWIDIPAVNGAGAIQELKITQGKSEEFPNCSCCGGSCSYLHDPFDGDALKCWWISEGAPGVVADGKVSFSSAAKITHVSGHSGVNSDCEQDCSVKVTTQVKAPTVPGTTGRWYINLLGGDGFVTGDTILAELNLVVNDLGTLASGSISISIIVGGVGSPITLSTNNDVEFEAGEMLMFSLCHMYGDFVAVVKGENGDTFHTDYSVGQGDDSDYGYNYEEDIEYGTDFCFLFASLQVPLPGVGGDFYDFQISHNLDSVSCDDCYSDQDDDNDDDQEGTPGDQPTRGPYIPQGPVSDTCDYRHSAVQVCAGGVYPRAVKGKLTFNCTHAPAPPGFPPIDHTCAISMETWLRSTHILRLELPMVTGLLPEDCPFIEGYEGDDYCSAIWSTSYGTCPEFVNIGFGTFAWTYYTAYLAVSIGRKIHVASGDVHYRLYGTLSFLHTGIGLSGSFYNGSSDIIATNEQILCLTNLRATIPFLCADHGEEDLSPCDEVDAEDIDFVLEVANV